MPPRRVCRFSPTAGQIAAMNNGPLPVGVRAGAAGQAFDVGYLDAADPAISADSATGVVLGVDLRLVRTVAVQFRAAGRCRPAPCSTRLRWLIPAASPRA